MKTRSLRRKRLFGNLLTYCIVAAAFVILQLLNAGGMLSPSLQGQLVPICAYVTMAVALNLVVGISGELSLGHAGFMSVGAFSGVVASISLQELIPMGPLRLLVSMLIGAFFAGIAGVIVGVPVLRLRGDYLAIVTLAFGEIIKNIINILYVGVDENGLHFSTSSEAALNLSETGKAILDGFSEYGLKGLAFWENGFRNITTTDKDIATVADLSGLKIRTMANEIHLEAWKAMGANPTPMAFGELFTGLQQGTVDGQENPLGIITGNKFEEVQSYCTLTEHVYTPYYVVMNQAKWDSLTAEQQEALTKAIEETTQRQYELSQQYEDEAIEVMEGAGCAVRTLTDEEKLGFKEAADKANSLEAAKKIMYKPELADQMAAELEAYRNK